MMFCTDFRVLLLMVLFSYTESAVTAKNGEGDTISDLPCVTRLNQLSCSGQGSSYPITNINTFILENRALMRRMYGELQELRVGRRTLEESTRHLFRRDILEGTLEELTMADIETETNHTDTLNLRPRRQVKLPAVPRSGRSRSRSDVCRSTVEIATPYWASNSNGKVRAILNSDQFEQAVHQEICSASTTSRCNRDCSCEQKYKWHRLLAYDPNNDCAGIFMDWFLFPSCCVCRCSDNPFLAE